MKVLPRVEDVVVESLGDEKIEKQIYSDGSYGIRKGDKVTRYFKNGAVAQYIYNDEHKCFAIHSSTGPHGEKFEWHRNGALKREQYRCGLVFEYDEYARKIYAKFTDDVECRWYRENLGSPAENHLWDRPSVDEISKTVNISNELTESLATTGKFFLEPADWEVPKDPPSYYKYPNGLERDGYENNSLRCMKYPDGSEYEWYQRFLRTDNFQLKRMKTSNGDEFSWNERGQIIHEKHPDGTERWWHDNEQMRAETLPDGTKTVYDEEGKIIYHATKGVEDTVVYLAEAHVREKKEKKLKNAPKIV